MSKIESQFQSKLIKRIKDEFPGCVIEKQDAKYIQGIPDLVIFYKNKYAMLECKENATAPHRPNQDYYISLFKNWSYAAFVYPENEEQIVKELQEVFK
ncbi:hypothetical protein [Lachnoclostridium sp. Marseille-P6806]|uniref:hypothetical protein n=1 Tax=Lachnoclostridium sp. Marseille-P6806 TaxID=2364793 RepID=UPI002ED67586